jgi:transposase-like protein
MRAVETLRWPHCLREGVVKSGSTSNGKERLRCQQGKPCGRTSIRGYSYPGRTPEGKRQIIELTLQGSGVRDIARVWQGSPTTVIGELKKRPVGSPRSRRSSRKGAGRTR